MQVLEATQQIGAQSEVVGTQAKLLYELYDLSAGMSSNLSNMLMKKIKGFKENSIESRGLNIPVGEGVSVGTLARVEGFTEALAYFLQKLSKSKDLQARANKISGLSEDVKKQIMPLLTSEQKELYNKESFNSMIDTLNEIARVEKKHLSGNASKTTLER